MCGFYTAEKRESYLHGAPNFKWERGAKVAQDFYTVKVEMAEFSVPTNFNGV